ncbi:MAG: class I SAM-dependent methyltransferase [Bacteroidia bacterium]|nr:class I SAM-dependent methyltransferase [Bacteroidota bacterium]MBK8873515.1 class I SAM-dependent methyltransferase [Bacteroidota bacterium]MBK9047753.1 class I SAM-dependent methyltransferase [Bacteroidota bacterium]MBL0073524.1 class I SAM-dependent methyltransferase [Bacteroidota bacterium]MBP9083002.1 class I SAM-dependent methyltransferase [Bacteroidia bacterium]
MEYDPIKRSLGNVFNKNPFLRKTFYRLLDLLLLRAWHVHLELRKWMQVSPQNASILDAGAGFGQYTYWLNTKSKDYSILSVDVKDEQVADCNRFFREIGAKNVLFEVGDLTKYYKDNSYDLVLSVDVMEHILEDVQVFKNFHRSMKTGGMLLISTPSDQGGSDVHGDGETSFIEEHVRDGYNIVEIADKLKSAGFSKVEARYSYGSPGKISWRLSMKYPIVFLGKVPKVIGFLILPFYYLIAYPVSFILNFLDTRMNHATGTGLIVKAWK